MKASLILPATLLLITAGCRSSRQSAEVVSTSAIKKLNTEYSLLSVSSLELDSVCLEVSGSDSIRPIVVRARKLRLNTSSDVSSKTESTDSVAEHQSKTENTTTKNPAPFNNLWWIAAIMLGFTFWRILHNNK